MQCWETACNAVIGGSSFSLNIREKSLEPGIQYYPARPNCHCPAITSTQGHLGTRGAKSVTPTSSAIVSMCIRRRTIGTSRAKPQGFEDLKHHPSIQSVSQPVNQSVSRSVRQAVLRVAYWVMCNIYCMCMQCSDNHNPMSKLT